MDPRGVVTKLKAHEGTIHPALISEIEKFRATQSLMSSYYVNLNSHQPTEIEAMRIEIKDALDGHRQQFERLELDHATRQILTYEWESVCELAMRTAGERATRGLACFVASECRWACALRLPRGIRNRAFFEDRFVTFPLKQVLDQADRYCVCLTDKDEARVFLVFLEQIQEVADVFDEIPGRVHISDPFYESKYLHQHVQAFHRHFEKVAEAILRLFQRQPFERLIIGGLWETLPQFESHLHHYVRGRVAARWRIDVQTPTPQILERTIEEEQQLLLRQAENIWSTIQEQLPRKGALGMEPVFEALWHRNVQALLLTPGVSCRGFRCSKCGRMQLANGLCGECHGPTVELADVYEEAGHEAVEQSAQVRFWKDLVVKGCDSIAALKRFDRLREP